MIFAANCGTVYVTGPAAGVYKERGTQGNRGDFFSNNGVWNLYWAFYAGKPVNRNRRGLSVLEGVYGEEGGERRSDGSGELLVFFFHVSLVYMHARVSVLSFTLNGHSWPSGVYVCL